MNMNALTEPYSTEPHNVIQQEQEQEQGDGDNTAQHATISGSSMATDDVLPDNDPVPDTDVSIDIDEPLSRGVLAINRPTLI